VNLNVNFNILKQFSCTLVGRIKGFDKLFILVSTHKIDENEAIYNYVSEMFCRSQWPRGLKRRSAAARQLRSWVRILPEAWMFVVRVVCCQVEVSATSRSLVQSSHTDCIASLFVI
jgi:hypothetical protein